MFRTFSSSYTGPAGAAGAARAAATRAAGAAAGAGSSFLPQAASRIAEMARARTCFFMVRDTPDRWDETRRLTQRNRLAFPPRSMQVTDQLYPRFGAWKHCNKDSTVTEAGQHRLPFGLHPRAVQASCPAARRSSSVASRH